MEKEKKIEAVEFTEIEWDLITPHLGEIALSKRKEEYAKEIAFSWAEQREIIKEKDEFIKDALDIIICRALQLYDLGRFAFDWSSLLDRIIIEECCTKCPVLVGSTEAIAWNEYSIDQGLVYFRAAKSILHKTGWEVNGRASTLEKITEELIWHKLQVAAEALQHAYSDTEKGWPKQALLIAKAFFAVDKAAREIVGVGIGRGYS